MAASQIGTISRFLTMLVLMLAAMAATVMSHDLWLPLVADESAAHAHDDHDDDHHEGHDDHDDHPDDDHADHDDDHDDHDHGDHDHSDGAMIEVSANGLKNIGYQPFEVRKLAYDKLLTLPAMVVERPGRSQIHLSAPLTGIVSKIYAVPGEAVGEGEPLFDLKLTHEELVASQRDFLRTAESLEVVNREIKRLKSFSEGVIAGRRVLEQQYEKQKLEASLAAERQSLLLHGISEEQIATILKDRQLFRSLTVRAPQHSHAIDQCTGEHSFVIQRLGVSRGEQIEVGQELAVLADHCELHLEGQAFEDDARAIREALEAGRKITARLLRSNDQSTTGGLITNLEALYVSDQIDPTTRAFKVYLSLPNEVVLDKTKGGKRYLEWRYKPGQRMQINVPVESWQDQLVLPTEAVVDEGVEAYVYRNEGDHFDQVPVYVMHRDGQSAVLANNGAIRPGDTIAGVGAYQIHLALKNKSGGAIDPHAGHNH